MENRQILGLLFAMLLFLIKNWPFYNLICSKASKMLFSQAHRSRCSRSHSTVHRPSRLPPVNDVAVQRTFSVNWCCSTFAVLKWMEIVLCILAIALIEAGVQMWRAYGFILFMSAFCLAITFAGLIIKFCQLQTGENSAFPLQKLEISFNIFAVFGFCIAFALLCYDCIKLFDEAEDYYQAKENRPDSIELNDWRNRIVATTLPQLIEVGMNFQIHPWFLYNSYPVIADIYCILQISTAGIADTLRPKSTWPNSDRRLIDFSVFHISQILCKHSGCKSRSPMAKQSLWSAFTIFLHSQQSRSEHQPLNCNTDWHQHQTANEYHHRPKWHGYRMGGLILLGFIEASTELDGEIMQQIVPTCSTFDEQRIAGQSQMHVRISANHLQKPIAETCN
ncbi:hypothetical protein T02_8312 [Trichinella nativa]|uniref:Uncharacterized protein n=1 Tax=Trichinella nativa TaxID=6335 RepID=A0A0V1LBJ0_9BILA|nr:hypothetical protein T02_8312 [Trichinella nativa]